MGSLGSGEQPCGAEESGRREFDKSHSEHTCQLTAHYGSCALARVLAYIRPCKTRAETNPRGELWHEVSQEASTLNQSDCGCNESAERELREPAHGHTISARW